MQDNSYMISIIKNVVDIFKNQGISVDIDELYDTIAIKDNENETMIFLQGDDYIYSINDAVSIANFADIEVSDAILYRFEDLIYESMDVKDLLGHYI